VWEAIGARPGRDGIPMRRPSIGITSYWAPAVMGAWELDAAFIAQGYVEGVRLAGGRALVLPPDPLWEREPDDVLDMLDGLIVAGGNDIGADRYGHEPHPRTNPPHARRDAAELGLLRGALERDLPVLGICRGIQLLNVARGGTLVQHLEDVVDQAPHRLDDSSWGQHEVDTVSGTRTRAIIGERAVVRSHHHQGIGRVGAGLMESAYAPDGIVEALEDGGLRFCVGVLWHPEAEVPGPGQALFDALVSSTR
jgi:gamma-glutamyl-gamma-aminobutyrate hydrolase PuuD